MAKYYNNKVKTGKVAGSVFAVRYGEVIERAYNPIVANPKSEAQTSARARMKMMSQLSAIMAPAIAMPRVGSKSSRNRFVAKNYELTSYSNDAAQVTLEAIQLTDSAVGLPTLIVSRDQATPTTLNINLGAAPGTTLDRVSYFVFVKQPNGTLRLAREASVSDPTGGFATTVSVGTSAEVVVYAYGIRFNSQVAKTAYGDVTVTPATALARLMVSRTLLESDVTVTETKAVTVAEM